MEAPEVLWQRRGETSGGFICRIPWPSKWVSLIQLYACNTRIPPYPVVSCRILPYPAVSCCILPYPAVSCRILPYPAVSCRICRILPYPAFPAVSCRMPVTETLTPTLALTVILTWSFSYW